RSRRYPAFAGAPGFTVSILASGHKAVSARLAGQGEHSLDGLALLPTELGPPALADSLAVFECAREQVVTAGEQSVLIGRVLRFHKQQDGAPLVFFQGRYSGLACERLAFLLVRLKAEIACWKVCRVADPPQA